MLSYKGLVIEGRIVVNQEEGGRERRKEVKKPASKAVHVMAPNDISCCSLKVLGFALKVQHALQQFRFFFKSTIKSAPVAACFALCHFFVCGACMLFMPHGRCCVYSNIISCVVYAMPVCSRGPE